MSNVWFGLYMYISSIYKPQGLFPREIQGSGIGNSLEDRFHSNLSLPQQIYQHNLIYCII